MHDYARLVLSSHKVPRLYIDQGIHHTIAIMNIKGHLPIINEWKLNSDNTISGLLRGSNDYLDDTQITTAPIIGRVTAGSIVQTKSGTRYFLGGKASSSSSASGRYPLTAICETIVVADYRPR